jgi:hypothetical protein
MGDTVSILSRDRTTVKPLPTTRTRRCKDRPLTVGIILQKSNQKKYCRTF